MTRASILYGVCGIGLGHTFRQLPLIEHFAQSCRVVIFAYGESLKYYSARFADHANVSVERVSVPYFVGNRRGLDFPASARKMKTFPENIWEINLAAMARAQDEIGRPDLVVTDYEPVCAQYAYACDAPLVTLDQQSKYLIGDFPQVLEGEGYADEVQRLSMFFPAADARIACSFFRVPPKPKARFEVEVYPSILKPSIVSMKRKPDPKVVMVYVSSQREFVQGVDEVERIFRSQSGHRFHVFMPDPLPGTGGRPPACDTDNVTFYKHGDSRFTDLLETCGGLISTAGHSLLSEAMFLGIPTYAIPLAVYEQQMNAHVINAHGFGLAHPAIEAAPLERFLAGLPSFSEAIAADTDVLLRGSGEQAILSRLEGLLG